MSLKQYPFLTAVLGLFSATCLAGIGLSVWSYVAYSKTRSTLEKQEKQIAEIAGQQIVPTIASVPKPKGTPTPAQIAKYNEDRRKVRRDILGNNLDEAIKNLGDLEKQETDIFKQINGDRQFAPSSDPSPTNFVSGLRQDNTELTKAVQDIGARIYKPAEFGFGFSRYLGNDASTPSAPILPKLSVERQAVKWLVTQLLEAKNGAESPQNSDQNPLILQSVLREPIELTAANRSSRNDEYAPDSTEILRKDGIASGYFFRIVFTARTDVLRRFVKQVRNSGYPLALRSITVSPARIEVLTPPEPPAGALPAATPAPATGLPAGLPTVPSAVGVPVPPPSATAVAAIAIPGGAPPPLPPSDSSPAFPPLAGAAGSPPAAGTAAAPASQPVETLIVDSTPVEYTVSFEYLIPQTAPTPAPATTTSR